MRRHRTPAFVFLIALVVTTLAQHLRAAEVYVNLESREAFVGVPFNLVIEIVDAQGYDEPELPAIFGVRVLGPPSSQTSSSMSIVNGRMQQRKSVKLIYTLQADAPGSVEIPEFTVRADGKTYGTDRIAIEVTEAKDASLLEVEVFAPEQRVVLGQPITLVLRLYVRPYQDRSLQGPLDSRSMWSRIDVNGSTWGPFAETISSLVGGPMSRRRMLEGIDAPHPDAETHAGQYYMYEVAASVWPEQGGEVALDPVSVVMSYPIRIERSRRAFTFGELQVSEARPVVARAEMPRVVVETPPVQGRPAVYSGAVGRFDFEVSARPTDVAVGDPITITLEITDRTRGGVQMDLLRPPMLDQVPALTERFRLPTDPLAGVVAGRTKSFSQTIRARSSDVTAIPAIPFAFFDPQTREYVTVLSDPIPVDVRATSTVSMSDIVGGDPDAEGGTAELTEVSRGLRANITDMDAMLAVTHSHPEWWLLGLVISLPLVAGAVAVGHRRAHRLRTDTRYARQRHAFRSAIGRIDSAGSSDGPLAQVAASAITDYVADRCGLPAGALTPDEAVGQLSQRGASSDLVTEARSLLDACQHAVYAGASDNLNGIGDRARSLIESIERERLS